MKTDKFGQRIIPCKWCGVDTVMLGTQMCDGCWGLSSRIKLDPEMAKRMLNLRPELETFLVAYHQQVWEAGTGHKPASWDGHEAAGAVLATAFLAQFGPGAEVVVEEEHKPYITTTSGMSGYFAVMMWWNTEGEDNPGFWEPYNTGFYRGPSREEAVIEAKAWAEAEELEYKA